MATAQSYNIRLNEAFLRKPKLSFFRLVHWIKLWSIPTYDNCVFAKRTSYFDWPLTFFWETKRILSAHTIISMYNLPVYLIDESLLDKIKSIKNLKKMKLFIFRHSICFYFCPCNFYRKRTKKKNNNREIHKYMKMEIYDDDENEWNKKKII